VTFAFSVSADVVVLVLSVPSAALCYLCGKTFPSFSVFSVPSVVKILLFESLSFPLY
jgi:hypothetical protein